MSTLFPKPFQIIRSTRTLVRGVWTTGTSETLTFQGSIQPLSGKDLLTLEPASRDIGKVWIYTGSQLKKRTEAGANAADVLIYDGATWEVIDDRPYGNDIIPHHKYMAEYRGAYVPGD